MTEKQLYRFILDVLVDHWPERETNEEIVEGMLGFVIDDLNHAMPYWKFLNEKDFEYEILKLGLYDRILDYARY